MRWPSQQGFRLAASELCNDITIPRYYDPRIREDLGRLAPTHDLVSLRDLARAGYLRHDHGRYVPKINYGTGPYPYVRTSDIANWELKASPKHGVARDIYDTYSPDLDVQPDDILFVHEGTYLIGTTAIVTAFDGPLLYQHHLAKLRVVNNARFDSYFLLAALGSKIVQRQIRSKQFSADIIDSVVGRLEEVVVPVDKSKERLLWISRAVRGAITTRVINREKLSFLFRELEMWLLGSSKYTLEGIFNWKPEPDMYEGKPAFLGLKERFRSFMHSAEKIRNDIIMPKYYDPLIFEMCTDLTKTCELRTIGELISDGILEIDTGDEVGKINYGSGNIPFVRTSDLGSYELRADAKHGIDEAVYERYGGGQNVRAGDIFVVRDGTYLIGSSVIVFEEDLPLLYCGGIYKIRSRDQAYLHPGLCYALLNTPFVRRQIRSKQFTRDVIDTLGQRINEIVLPVPKDRSTRAAIGNVVWSLCEERIRKRRFLAQLMERLYVGDTAFPLSA